MNRDGTAQFQREQLHAAACDGDLERIENLLSRKYPVNRFDDLGKTPLHYAVEAGHLDVVDRLLRAGAKVDARDERRIADTALADNVRDCSYEMAKRLIDAGADPTLPGWMQLTAIDRAAERKDVDAQKVQQLLQDAAQRRKALRRR